MISVTGVQNATSAPAERVIPLKHIARLNIAVLDESTDPEYAFDYVDISSVTPEVGIARRERVTFGTAPSRARRKVARGDTIVSTVRTYLRAVAFVDEPDDLVVSTGFAVLSPRPGIDHRYLYRAAQTKLFVDEVVARSTGVSYPAISPSDLGQIGVCLPDVGVQHAIADFLDRETEKIDALVAKKQRLIELLQEKRTALISHAVTRGLDSDVPMKFSGIEWLGAIPAHWRALPLRRVLTGIDQGWSPECESRTADDGEWGVLKAGCVNRGEFDDSQHKALPSELTSRPHLEVHPGDLLMSRASGSEELVGSVAHVAKCRRRLMLSDKVFRLHVNPQWADAEYVALAMNSRAARGRIESVLSGSVGLARNIGQPTIREHMACFPPLEEQRAIVSHVERAETRINDLMQSVAEAIERLREYRSALITAAVTGQIDVGVR